MLECRICDGRANGSFQQDILSTFSWGALNQGASCDLFPFEGTGHGISRDLRKWSNQRLLVCGAQVHHLSPGNVDTVYQIGAGDEIGGKKCHFFWNIRIHGPFDFVDPVALGVVLERYLDMTLLYGGSLPMNGTTDLTVTVAKRIWQVFYACLCGFARMP